MTEVTDYDGLVELRKKSVKKSVIAIAGTVVLFFVSFVACMSVGNYVIPFNEVFLSLFGKTDASSVYMMRITQ